MAAVSANSLSAITQLAANPPQYPRNPSHQERSPLILYIARVPGSRDVFLSPLKPREKVVTAEDVQSCLYFLHVDRPEDEKLRTELAKVSAGTESPIQTHSPRRKGLPSALTSTDTHLASITEGVHPQRKPLPSVPLTPKSLPIGKEASSSSAPTTSESSVKIPHRKPVSHLKQNVPYPLQIHGSAENSVILRKALGTDQSHDLRDGLSVTSSGLKKNAQSSLARDHRLDAQQPAMSESIERSRDNPSGLNDDKLSEELQKRPVAQPIQSSRTVLTLIRRDPVSGDQWNVASILDPQIYDVTSETLDIKAKRQQGSPLHVEVTNTGYMKFLRAIPDVPALLSRSTGSSMSSMKMLGQAKSGEQAPYEDGTDGIFRRRLWMENSRHSTHGRVRSDFGMRSVRSSSNDKRPSIDLNSSVDTDEQGINATSSQRIVAIPGTERRSAYMKGYTFLSPWNGRCEFSTGAAGNSLRCKHSLPTVASGAGDVSPPVMVSDLRFNLPTSVTSKTAEVSLKLSSFLNRPRARSHVLSSTNSESHSETDDRGRAKSMDRPDRLDLSLGQEHAGGGIGGKRAKLGKLVIEDEGLKMLDLLVAANMGLWWRAYEKVSGFEEA